MLQKLTKYFLIFFIIVPLSSCNNRDTYFDKNVKLNREDIFDKMVADKNKKKKELAQLEEAPIPKISSMLSLPKPPEFTQGNQIISFSVTDDIDLKDVLIELGRVTQLDVDVDPKISGGVIINAKNRPLIEIIQRISKLGGLRYSFENGVLTFKNDVPYSKHYVVDYLIDGTLWDEVSTNVNAILTNISSTGSSGSPSSVSPNKSAGIITVFANDAGQKVTAEYLKEVKESASAQVLIEAKVIEVTLNDKYSAGIDWTAAKGATEVKNISAGGNVTDPLSIVIAGTGTFSSFDIKALEEFGNIRAISSPRISALNNQQAKLDFIDKLVYFTIETENTTTASTTAVTSETVTATLNEEPIGVELSITPSIDIKNNEITLAVNPKLSIQNGSVPDPTTVESVDKDGNTIREPAGNTVPIIQTREISTTMKVNSGDTLVIGGLMKEETSNTDTGIPFLSRIPFLGNLFKFVSKETKVIETVIFIKATIVDSANGVSKYDRDFHNDFTADRKPYF